jgi:hypothetical protein
MAQKNDNPSWVRLCLAGLDTLAVRFWFLLDPAVLAFGGFGVTQKRRRIILPAPTVDLTVSRREH